MTDHLPECLLPDFDKGVWVCCCAQLRACEQRIIRERGLVAAEYMADGYAAGLAAAREVVAALRDENRQGTDPEWGVLNSALAAIDALLSAPDVATAPDKEQA